MLDQDDLFNALDDIGDHFSELNAGSDSDSDKNSDNEFDDNGINNTEINNLHEENDESEVIPIRPRITYSTNGLVNFIETAFGTKYSRMVQVKFVKDSL